MPRRPSGRCDQERRAHPPCWFCSTPAPPQPEPRAVLVALLLRDAPAGPAPDLLLRRPPWFARALRPPPPPRFWSSPRLVPLLPPASCLLSSSPSTRACPIRGLSLELLSRCLPEQEQFWIAKYPSDSSRPSCTTTPGDATSTPTTCTSTPPRPDRQVPRRRVYHYRRPSKTPWTPNIHGT